jgi:hypothetical protein
MSLNLSKKTHNELVDRSIEWHFFRYAMHVMAIKDMLLFDMDGFVSVN